MNFFGQMGNNMNISPDKMEKINHLTNQNMIMQQQIQQNNILIQKLMSESQQNQNLQNVINVRFTTAQGLTKVIQTRENIQANALLRVYMIRMGVENKLFDEDIVFIHNGKRIDKHDTREINHPDIGIIDGSLILVNDLHNKIPGHI